MNISYCPSCGGKVDAGKPYCLGCGFKLSDDTKSVSLSKKNNLRDIAIILGSLVIFIVGFFAISKSPQMPRMQTQDDQFQHPSIAGVQPGTANDFDKVISQLPKGYDSLIQNGNHFMDNQVFSLAIECYNRALAIKSNDPNVITDLGACYHTMGDNQKAIESFEKAISVSPDHPVAHFNLGIVYRGMDNTEKAKYYWKKYLELDPQSPIADSIKKYISLMK